MQDVDFHEKASIVKADVAATMTACVGYPCNASIGIYALERIAKESREDYWPVMEILTAYVREHAPWGSRSIGQPR